MDWAQVAKGPLLAAQGVALNFVAPVLRDGKKIARLPKSELAEWSEKWASAMVFYVVGSTPTITTVKKCVASNWNNVSTPRIFLHDDGYLLSFIVLLIGMKYCMLGLICSLANYC